MQHGRQLGTCVMLFTVIALVGCSAGPSATQQPQSAVVQINPLAEGASMDETAVRLYYGFGDARLLAGENRRIKVPANESVEMSLLSELIQEGPSEASANLTRVINPQTTVAGVSMEGQFATVTFSSEFLSPVGGDQGASSAQEENERVRRYLAAYSVVNTLIEQGNCSRVRIMIDDGIGAGRPITYAECGMPGTGDAQPFERNGEIELTPGVTMRTLLSAVERRDWAQAYSFIAYRNQRGQDKPDAQEFQTQVESARFVVSDAQVIDYVASADGQSVIVMVSYNLTSAGSEPRQFTNIPKRLILEDDVWKMTWNDFEVAFMRLS